MKEFDKWLKENDWQCWLYDEEDAAKEGWRAALKWVESMFSANIGWQEPRFNVRDEVLKELKNGDT